MDMVERRRNSGNTARKRRLARVMARSTKKRSFQVAAERLLLVIYHHIAAVTWPAVLLISTVHFLSSWLLMAIVEQGDLTTPSLFWYYYIVTASTVGYGDFAPATAAGRAAAVFWVMPGGIAIFTTVAAKLVQSVANYWRRRMVGKADHSDLTDHTVIMGWNGENTRKMVDQLLGASRERKVVLASYRLTENPMPDQVGFVRGEALTSDDVLQRSGAKSAASVIVMGQDDNETLAVCLAVAAYNDGVHLVAYFSDEKVADLLKAHCPRAECLVPMATEILVRTADDPGSSRVPKLLFSALDGPTLYSITVPESVDHLSFKALFTSFRAQTGATILGVASGLGADQLHLNPPDERLVSPGETLYYIGERRLSQNDIAWGILVEDTA